MRDIFPPAVSRITISLPFDLAWLVCQRLAVHCGAAIKSHFHVTWILPACAPALVCLFLPTFTISETHGSKYGW